MIDIPYSLFWLAKAWSVFATNFYALEYFFGVVSGCCLCSFFGLYLSWAPSRKNRAVYPLRSKEDVEKLQNKEKK